METTEEFIARKERQFQDQPIINMKDIGREGRHFFYREAWTFMAQSNLEDKVFVIERLKKDSAEGTLSYKDSWRKGDIEYRIGYFIKGKIGRTRGKWVWGQFCPLIPAEDMQRLLDKAKSEKTLLV